MVSGEGAACPEGKVISRTPVLKGTRSSSSKQRFLCNNLIEVIVQRNCFQYLCEQYPWRSSCPSGRPLPLQRLPSSNEKLKQTSIKLEVIGQKSLFRGTASSTFEVGIPTDHPAVRAGSSLPRGHKRGPNHHPPMRNLRTPV